MSMKIITGSTGTTHVTSNNDGELNQAIFGTGVMILPNGNQLKATVIDNNTIRIEDGDLMFQGRHALIEPSTDETVAIATGAAGYNRIDLIVAHYSMDSGSGHEAIELKVIKGTNSTGNPSAPSITTGDIRKGAKVAEAILYRVEIRGISISSCTRVVDVAEIIKNTADSALAEATRVANTDATQTAKGLMSAADKAKLDGIATGANKYSLPTASTSTKGGIKVGANLSMNGDVLSATNTTYSNATTSAAGLMSAADKTKLNGIATGATAVSDATVSGWGYKKTDTTYSNATQSTAGLMSAADKKKLDGIASGANAYSLPAASSGALGGIKVSLSGTTLYISTT